MKFYQILYIVSYMTEFNHRAWLSCCFHSLFIETAAGIHNMALLTLKVVSTEL